MPATKRKWAAWNGNKGKSKEASQAGYVAAVERIFKLKKGYFN